MIQARIKRANITYRGPPGICSVSARRFQYQDGSIAISTLWEPTPEEIADIVAGRPVYLTILARSMPPAKLSTRPEEHDQEET